MAIFLGASLALSVQPATPDFLRAARPDLDANSKSALHRLRGGAFSVIDGLLSSVTVTAALVAVNIAQNGSPEKAGGLDTPCTSLEDALALERKSDFVRLFHKGSVPSLLSDEYDGRLSSLGVLAPVSGFITNRLFGNGRPWRGKVISGDTGVNARPV